MSWASRIGYDFGDFGFNLFFTTASLFLLFYYTDVLGLSPQTAGWVFAGALVWDAVFDPLMGYVASRTRTRWGRYRPYILWGAVPLGLSWVLMFLPNGLTGAALVLFATATHILFRTMFAVVMMPFLALSAALTSDSHERGVVAGLRMIAAAFSGLVIAASTLALVELFGGGRVGFFWVSVCYAIVATIVIVGVFVSTVEIAPDESERQPDLREMLSMLRRNRAFWIVSASMLFSITGQTFFQKMLPYYFKYRFGREDLIGPGLAVAALGMAVSIPFWTWIMRITSKRAMALYGIGVGLVASTLLWLFGQTPGAVVAVLALAGIGVGSGYLSFWAMMPDTVEYGEWRSGVRAEGAVFGLVSLIQKASFGFAAAALGEVLGAIGFRANVPQSAATLDAMRVLLIVLPACMSIGMAAVLAFYPIDQSFHERMLRIIRWRQDKAHRRSVVVDVAVVPAE